ncbi:MAG: hypothetical protein LBG80_12445 [Bacteroidales bacterium]|jgi:ribosomal protein L19E|nr:hypothetical protein [Bacteroidales bacterium]
MGNTRSKWWNGSISERFGNIDNLVNRIIEHQPAWTIPTGLFDRLIANRNQLKTVITVCNTPEASNSDRKQRKTLLLETVNLCRRDVRPWAYGLFSSGVMTKDDFHTLGFLLPGESEKYLNAGAAIDRSIYYKWRKGNINERFDNINNLVNCIIEHPAWALPAELFDRLAANRDQLQTLINLCKMPAVSNDNIRLRKTLLDETVHLCRNQIRSWAYNRVSSGVMTVDDIHRLGFLLPGESEKHLRTGTAINKSTYRKWWNGSISEKFDNIDNLVNRIIEHQPAWTIPSELFDRLTANRDKLQTLMNLCKTQAASNNDRKQRKTLLLETVRLCRRDVHSWAQGLFSSGVMTADDIHQFGFLLPGEFEKDITA